MTFDEFKAKYDKAPYTEEQKELMERFDESLADFRDKILADNDEEKIDKFGDFIYALSYICEDPDSFISKESRGEWEKDRESLKELQQFMLEDDNFEEIMDLLVGNSVFGKNAEIFFDMMDFMAEQFGIPFDAPGWRKNFEDYQNGINWKEDYEDPYAGSRESVKPQNGERESEGPETGEPETEEPEHEESVLEGSTTAGSETIESEAEDAKERRSERIQKDIARFRGDTTNKVAKEFNENQGKNLADFPKELLTNAGLRDSRLHSNAIIFDFFVMAKHGVDLKDIPKFERGELEGHDKSQYLQEFRTFLEEHPISKEKGDGEREYFPENAKAWGQLYSEVDKKLSEYRLPDVDLGNPDSYADRVDEIAMLNKIGTDAVQVIQDHQMEKFRNPELNAAFVQGFGSMKDELHFWSNCSTLQNIKAFMGQAGVEMSSSHASVELNSIAAGRWFATQNQDLYKGKTIQEFRKNIPFMTSILTITAQKSMSSYKPEEREAIESFLEKGTPLPSNIADSYAQAVDMIKTGIHPDMVAEEVKGELNTLTGRGMLDGYVNQLSVDGEPGKITDVKDMTPEQRSIAEKCYDSIIFSAYNMYSVAANMTEMNMEPFDLIRINETPVKKYCEYRYDEKMIFGDDRKWADLKPEEQESYIKMEVAGAMLDPLTKLECHTLEQAADGTLSVSKKGAVAGKFDEKTYQKNKEEKEKRKERENFRHRKQIVLDNADTLYKRFIDIYGPDGKMPRGIGYESPEEYDNIKIEVPEGLDELTVTAIVIGAAMDPKYMSRASSGSTSLFGTVVENNQMHLVNNVVKGDDREIAFCPLMTEARLEAKEALEAYKAGDKTKVTQMLQNFVNYSVSAVGTVSAGSFGIADIDVEKQAYMLGQDIIDKGILGVKPHVKGCTEINDMRLQSYKKQMDAFIRADRSKMELMDHFGDIDKNTRDNMIADLIFDSYISSMAEKQDKARQKEMDKAVEEVFGSFGVDVSSDEYQSDISTNRGVVNTAFQMMPYIQNYTITDFDAILAKPEGLDQLKSLYMDEIKKSDEYKKLTGAASAEELTDQFIKVGKVFDNGITSVKNVKLPEESKPYNEKYKKLKRQTIKDVQSRIIDAAYKEDEVWAGEVEEYGLKSLEPEDVKKHADQISGIYNELEALDSWRSPQSFKDLLGSLEEIRDLTQKNAGKGSILNEKEAVAYQRAVEKFERLANIYFDGDAKKGNEAERAKAVGKIRLHVNAGKVPVSDSITKMENKMKETLFGEQRKLLNSLNPLKKPGNDVFLGEKYKDQHTRQSSQYTLYRTAGISVAVFALFNTGKYSFDEIMDPEKLQAEKREMFDQVAQRMLRNTPENQEWIAKTIYEGQKNTERAMNEQAKLVDFSSADIATDKRLCQMLHLASIQFDAWQEKTHCKNEITKLATAEHPELKTYEDYHQWWDQRKGPLGLINECLSKIEEKAIDLATSPDETSSHLRNILSEYASMKNYMNAISEGMSLGDKPFTECVSFDRLIEERSKGAIMGGTIGKYARAFDGKHLAAMEVLGDIIDDTYLIGKDIEVDIESGKVELKGFPTAEEISKKDNFLRADGVDAVTKFGKIGRDAQAATKGVLFGSKQYDEAMSAIDKVHEAFKELQEIEKKRIEAGNRSDMTTELADLELEKRDKQFEVRGLMAEAKDAIQKYFDRKEKRGEMGRNADAKSKRRIAVMKDAMNAIDGYTQQLDAEDIAAEAEARYSQNMSMGDTVDTEAVMVDQSMAQIRKADYTERANTAKGAEKIILRSAANAVSVLEKIGGEEGSSLTLTDLRAVKFAMAALVLADMLNGPEGDNIRAKMPDGADAYKAQIKKMVDSKEFDSAMPEITSREEVMELAGDESKTRQLYDSIKEKTAELAAKKTGPEKGRKSVGPEQKKEQEVTQRKRSNTVAGKMAQPRI